MVLIRNRVVVASACLLLLLLVQFSSGDEGAGKAAAPDAAAPASGTAEEETAPEEDSMLALIMDSGAIGLLFMGALGVFSLMAVAVIIERLVNTRRDRIVPEGFVSELRLAAGTRNSTPADLKAVCDRHNVPASKILLAGIVRAGRPLTEVEKAMEDAAARELAALRSRVRPLSVVGSVAPLLGLLGTVVGMIIAFRTASQSGLGKGEMLAQGIYLALVTTAAGLSIAIPSILCAAYFNSKIEGFFRIIDEGLTGTFSCFARVEEHATISASPRSASDGDNDRGVDKLLRVK